MGKHEKILISHLFRICTDCFWFKIISDQKATSENLDQTAWMCWLIWIYTGCTRVKMIYISRHIHSVMIRIYTGRCLVRNNLMNQKQIVLILIRWHESKLFAHA
jgi:hypothetical protein